MNEEQLRGYAALMRELGLTGLDFDENGKVRRMEMNSLMHGFSLRAEEEEDDNEIGFQLKDDNAADNKDTTLMTVTSPFVGVFYEAPSADAKPFVSVGDEVKKGDVLCIVEAMKLMNEILAEQDGVIEEICAQNNQVVEYGQKLFVIRVKQVEQ